MSEGVADLIVRYHHQTKHHLHRFARSPGYLDWATQPDPFRTFAGTDTTDLVAPILAARESGAGADPGWADVSFDGIIDVGVGAPVEPGLGAVSLFLRFSLGLSAWKQAGASRWALRVNPSSGNLHPTEGYVLLGPGPAGAAGAFHYAPERHALERRSALDDAAWATFATRLPEGAFLAGLTSIHWREAWKYGERAFRYCQHDVGHALAAMSVAAAMIGWRVRLCPGWSSDAMAALFGLDRAGDFDGAEPEEPACVLLVSPAHLAVRPPAASAAQVAAARAATWTGLASRLSPERVPWDWIDAAAEATRVPEGAPAAETAAGESLAVSRTRTTRRVDVPASRLLLQRRSAVAMDGESAIDRERFLLILRRTLASGQPPFDALWWTPRIHLVLFVHRVSGLVPGLYALPRAAGAAAALREAFHQDFAWIRPEGVPDDLPLFLLSAMDVRRVARHLSCMQDIAADGFFSLGMLAEFDASLEQFGAPFYRNLFWEAGAVGQTLYLEAEAAGCRGTGIGCFFDDAVHDVLGLKGSRFQSLYHFTIGAAVDDMRLLTRPGYAWE